MTQTLASVDQTATRIWDLQPSRSLKSSPHRLKISHLELKAPQVNHSHNKRQLRNKNKEKKMKEGRENKESNSKENNNKEKRS